jgi:hypothetical protein
VDPDEPLNASEPFPAAHPFASPDPFASREDLFASTSGACADVPTQATQQGPRRGSQGSRETRSRVADALLEITPILDAPDMEPDLERIDWSGVEGRIDAAHALYDEESPASDRRGLRIIPSASELRLELATDVAWIRAELAALLLASKRTDDAQRLLLRVTRMAPSEAPAEGGALGLEVRAELEGTMANTPAWVQLVHDPSRRRSRSSRGPGAHSPARRRSSAIKRGGASIDGDRDRRPDGSHVTTYCECLRFVHSVIPLRPTSALRRSCFGAAHARRARAAARLRGREAAVPDDPRTSTHFFSCRSCHADGPVLSMHPCEMEDQMSEEHSGYFPCAIPSARVVA